MKSDPKETPSPLEPSLTQQEIDVLWKIEVERRIAEVESGRVKTVPAEAVFAKIQERFGTS